MHSKIFKYPSHTAYSSDLALLDCMDSDSDCLFEPCKARCIYTTLYGIRNCRVFLKENSLFSTHERFGTIVIYMRLQRLLHGELHYFLGLILVIVVLKACVRLYLSDLVCYEYYKSNQIHCVVKSSKHSHYYELI